MNKEWIEVKNNNIELSQGKRPWHITWFYPEIYDRSKQSTLEIDLCHTRASDGIRIKYDSERNGWVIEQASVFQWDDNNDPDGKCDPKWKEAAFIPSWQFDNEQKHG